MLIVLRTHNERAQQVQPLLVGKERSVSWRVKTLGRAMETPREELNCIVEL